MSVVGFVNFKGFSSGQVPIKAAGQVQSLLRLAQSNATSSTVCNNSGALSWQLVLSAVSSNIALECSNTSTTFSYKTYTLENAEVSSITGSASGCNSSSAKVIYTAGVGVVNFNDSANTCINSANSLTITVRDKNNNSSTKNIIISKGGAINVQ